MAEAYPELAKGRRARVGTEHHARPGINLRYLCACAYVVKETGNGPKSVANAKIVIPCYNEEDRLDVSTFTDFKNSSHNITFLFVNDGSTDGTFRLLERLQKSEPAKFNLLNLPYNQGKAEAVRQGLLAGISPQHHYIGFWDADLATPLDAIPAFLDLAESRPDVEMIFGARVKLLGRRIQRRTARHYIGRLFATAVSMMLGLAIYDTQCGAKLFRVSSSLHGLFDKPFLSRWIFDVEIIARLIQARRGKQLPQPEQVIYEFPLIEWRDVHGSKLGYADFVRAAWELASIYERYLWNRS
jgi:dolichyl-phosphate beta-glucosyltransferase